MPTAISKSRQLSRLKKPRRELPHIFGRGGRDRVLICLAVNGPLTVRELARAIKADAHKTWDMVHYLLQTGLVVKRVRPGGRKYVALNRKLPVHHRLRELLAALERRWPAKRVPQPSYRWTLWNDAGEITAPRLDLMFYSPVRSRILLFIAAVGFTDMSTIYQVLGVGAVSALYAVNHWEREGIVLSQHLARHRFVSLDPQYPAYTQLRSLLCGLITYSEEYRALRSVGRSRMRKVLKVVHGPNKSSNQH
jgi:hypothetical protein